MIKRAKVGGVLLKGGGEVSSGVYNRKITYSTPESIATVIKKRVYNTVNYTALLPATAAAPRPVIVIGI